MASQGPNSPGTIADDAAVGVLTWNTLSNAATSDNAYAFAGNGYGSNQATHYLKLQISVFRYRVAVRLMVSRWQSSAREVMHPPPAA